MLAVFKTGGKQYSVKSGQILKVEKLDGSQGDSVYFNDVLAVSDDSDHTIGSPLIKGAIVEAKILEQIRDKKIIVFKKRRRKNYRRTQGHRQYLTVLQIESISVGNKKSKTPTKEVKKQVINSWENLGRTFFELLILPKIMNSQNNRISVEGMNFLEEIKKNGEQVIFFGIHQSNWEILLPMIDRMDFNVGGIYRHINNPYINKLILNQRKKSIASNDSFYTPKGKKSAKDILDGIKKNSSIVLLIDQKDSAGEDVVFFNSVTKTQTGFLKIAKKHKMQIIPVQNIRNNLNNFTLNFILL